MHTKSNKLIALATELLNKNEINEAVEALKRSTRMGDADDMKVYMDVASNLFNQKDYNKAKIFIRAFVDERPSAEAYFMLGDVEYKTSNISNAIDCYKNGIEHNKSEDIAPYNKYVSLCVEEGDIDKVVLAYKTLVTKKDDDKVALSFLSKHYRDAKDYKSAVVYYEKIDKYGFGEYIDYQNYGSCLYEVSEYEKSERMYMKAVELFPASSNVSQELKNLRSKNLKDMYPDLEASEKLYKKSAEEEKNHSSYFHLGNIAFIKGDYEEASRLYEKAKEIYSSLDLTLAM